MLYSFTYYSLVWVGGCIFVCLFVGPILTLPFHWLVTNLILLNFTLEIILGTPKLKSSINSYFCNFLNDTKTLKKQGLLDGSVCWASDLNWGHDLTVHESEPHVGFCAEGSEPGAYFRSCVSSSLCPSLPPLLSLSLSLKNKET